MRINFMDISRQIKNCKPEFMEAVGNVVDDAAFSGGKYAAEFEKGFADYVGTKYCSGLGSGTGALLMAMKALGIKEGDEVIVPANTFIATAWGPYYCGAKPVFVDCDRDTWEIDANKMEEKITERTKAVIGVHLYGQPFDFDAVNAVASRNGIPVVEDCAQAHGAIYKGRSVGTLGEIACFSFYPGKNLGAFGEAGAVTTNNREYFEKIEMMKNHGSCVQYHHDTDGYNLRMDGIQGAVLSVKLKYLDEWNRKRRSIAFRYRAGINNPKIKLQKMMPDVISANHLFEVEADDAGTFIGHMKEYGIQCGRHYPIPCHLQKVFEHLGNRKGDIPVSEYHAEHCVSLPMFPEMMENEVNYVIDTINLY